METKPVMTPEQQTCEHLSSIGLGASRQTIVFDYCPKCGLKLIPEVIPHASDCAIAYPVGKCDCDAVKQAFTGKPWSITVPFTATAPFTWQPTMKLRWKSVA